MNKWLLGVLVFGSLSSYAQLNQDDYLNLDSGVCSFVITGETGGLSDMETKKVLDLSIQSIQSLGYLNVCVNFNYAGIFIQKRTASEVTLDVKHFSELPHAYIAFDRMREGWFSSVSYGKVGTHGYAVNSESRFFKTKRRATKKLLKYLLQTIPENI